MSGVGFWLAQSTKHLRSIFFGISEPLVFFAIGAVHPYWRHSLASIAMREKVEREPSFLKIGLVY